MNSYDTIVIGAGLNGLSAATMLAAAGRSTLVLEQRPQPGGMAGPHAFSGGAPPACILQDTGSLMPGLLAPLRLANHGLELMREKPPLHVLLPGGGRITISDDRDATRASIASHSSRDAAAYDRFRDYCSRVAPVFRRLFGRSIPQRRRDLIALLPRALAWWRQAAVHELLRLAPLSAKDFLDEHFELDGLKASLAIPAFQAAYGGPLAPFGALPILMREALSGHFVRGGPAALAGALQRAAIHHGVEIATRSRAVEILGPGASGIRLDSGQTIGAGTVAAACSPQEVFGTLLPSHRIGQQFSWQMRNLRSRGTTAHLTLALDAPADRLAPRARMAPDLIALERAFDCMKHGILPEHYALEVTPHADRSILSVLAHFVPYRPAGDWTPAARQALTNRITAQLSPHISGSVGASLLLTPQDLEREFRLPGGHLHHVEQAPDQMIVRSAAGHLTPLDNLFLCGSGTHPGGGISCASGALAARTILAAKKQDSRRLRTRQLN